MVLARLHPIWFSQENMRVLNKNNCDIIQCKEIDKQVKNKFRFEWLETVVRISSEKLGLQEREVRLSDCIQKVDIPV